MDSWDSEIFRNMLCVLGRLPCGGECTVLYVRVYNDGDGRNDGSFIMVKLITTPLSQILPFRLNFQVGQIDTYEYQVSV